MKRKKVMIKRKRKERSNALSLWKRVTFITHEKEKEKNQKDEKEKALNGFSQIYQEIYERFNTQTA